MIKKTYIISSSIKMSRHYIQGNPNFEYQASSFRNFVIDLYNYPGFVMENEEFEIPDIYQQDLSLCRIHKKLDKNNHFHEAMNIRGNRHLLL